MGELDLLVRPVSRPIPARLALLDPSGRVRLGPPGLMVQLGALDRLVLLVQRCRIYRDRTYWINRTDWCYWFNRCRIYRDRTYRCHRVQWYSWRYWANRSYGYYWVNRSSRRSVYSNWPYREHR